MEVITRFAPSPTGGLHIGNIRTALFTWLFARKHKGLFILRIEDTDIKRYISTSVKEILNVLNWLGLKWDKGPFYQSKRLKYYQSLINIMLKEGSAYKCYCSIERLLQIRTNQINKKQKMRYDGKCRNLLKTYKSNVPFIIRFRNPHQGKVVFTDEIRGIISVNNNELDDLVIQRLDGNPTYNFCVVADDIDMQITHVIRGDDHINNTPRQINIYQALNKSIPKYAHISTIVNKNRKKISKRNSTENITNYINNGFLPEAILNCIVRLGWSHGNQEIFSLKEMKNLFSFKFITSSSSYFDLQKLKWLNNYYLRKLPISKLIKYINPFLLKEHININNGPNLSKIIEILRNRCSTLLEIINNCRYFYTDNVDYTLFNYFNCLSYQLIIPLKKVFNALNNLNNWNIVDINISIHNVTTKLGLEIKEMLMLLRMIVTGFKISPSIDTVIFYVGKKRTILRIKKAILHIRMKKILT